MSDPVRNNFQYLSYNKVAVKNMFRTKSLSCKEMNTLIEKHQKSEGIRKENRHASLRSLIADKTLQYQRHMQKLVLQDSNLNFNLNRSAHKTPSKSRSNKKSIEVSGQPEKA